MPILFGTADLSGTVIELEPGPIEHSTEQGGKGGPQQKVFNYTQTIAIGLCERVDDTADASVGAIGGVTRIWENGTIVYDIRPQQEANTQLGTVAETDQQYADRLSVSADYAEGFTLYLGDELQDPDPSLEAYKGFGNVPDYRGLAYIVYPNRNLQNAQGLRHPSFTFECYQAGTGQCMETAVKSNVVLHPWMGDSDRNPINVLNNNSLEITFFDTNLPSFGTWNFSTIYTNETDVQAALVTAGYPVSIQYLGYACTVAGSDEMIQAGGIPVTGHIGGTPDPPIVTLEYNFRQPPDGFFSNAQRLAGLPASPTPGQVWHRSSGVAGAIVLATGDPTGPPVAPYPTREGDGNCVFADATVTVIRNPGPPTPVCSGLAPSLIPGYSVRTDGRLVKCNPWVLTTASFIKVLQNYTAGTTKSTYPLNPCLGPSDTGYSDEAFWTAAYDAAVADDAMDVGLVYGTDYPVTRSNYYALAQVICEGSGLEANIADIVTQVCKRAGLTASQIDVSDLTSLSVGGYSISGICDGADIIAPLRSIAFFDCVDSGNTLRFPTRGKEVVAILTADQIGCFDGGNTGGDGSSSTNVPPSVAIVRQDETTLPRSIRMHYKAVSRDYQDAEQDSPFRLTTRAVDDQDVSIPLCISDEQAIQAAEIMWSDAWAGQNSFTLSIDQSLAALEGGDCIGVPVDGFIRRMRIVSDSNSAFVLRKLSCVEDDQGSYISFAVASPPIRKPSRITFLSPTLAVFLNIPSLMDSDNNAGFYVVAYPDPSSGNKWNGATFYQSIDGTNFSQSVSSTQAGTVGTLDTAVEPSEAFTWDNTTVITVNLPESESFESRTDDAVLAGANAAAMGSDGRWEIIQFATATQITPTQWQLSRLLRGRRGTEYVMGSSQAGDQFVLVSTGDLVRVPLSVSQIGASYVYKVVSAGTSFSSGNTYDFISRGTALVPFSPVDATAESVTGGDIEISWTRRDRLGETLMSGMDVPLSDFPESFQVDIVEAPHSPSSPTVVFRTLATGTTSVRYSAADFAADYPSDSPGGPIYVRIYQMSLTMGRGTPLVATLEVT